MGSLAVAKGTRLLTETGTAEPSEAQSYMTVNITNRLNLWLSADFILSILFFILSIIPLVLFRLCFTESSASL